MILRNLIFYLKSRILPVESLETAQLILADLIEGGNPLMIARFGAVEIKALLYERSPLLFIISAYRASILLFTGKKPALFSMWL